MDPWSACLLPVSFAAFFHTGSTQGPLPSSTIERVVSASLFFIREILSREEKHSVVPF